MLQHAAANSGEDPHKFKMKIWIGCQPSGEVLAQFLSSAGGAVRTLGRAGDEEGGEYDVLMVMLQDQIQVVAVPGVDPFAGQVVRGGDIL
jgi:hypothetical protein